MHGNTVNIRTRMRVVAGALLAAVVLALTVTSAAQAAQIIAYDDSGAPIFDSPNWHAGICGDITAPDSTYVRNNLRDLAPRLLLRHARDSFDVRGYNDTRSGDPNAPDSRWLYGTGHSATEGDYNGWVPRRAITNQNAFCVG